MELDFPASYFRSVAVSHPARQFTSILSLGLVVCSIVRATPSEGAADRDFALKAAGAGEMVVALGRTAQRQGLDAGVKRYARQVVDDHRNAMDELRQAARGKNLALSTAMTGDQQGALNRLQRLSGAAFDRAYIPQQVEAHRKAVDLFEREARDGQDPQFRVFAAWMLPSLREHLRMAEALQAEIRDAEPRLAP